MPLLLSAFLTCALASHVMAMKAVQRIGTDYVRPDNPLDARSAGLPVWDAGHAYFRDVSHLAAFKDAFQLVFVVPFLTRVPSTLLLAEFAARFGVILLLRSLLLCTTVLPRHDHCKLPRDLGMIQSVTGGCHDKMFSGHFSFGLLLTLLAFGHGYVRLNVCNAVLFAALNVANALLIVSTRSHYTADVVVAALVTLLVFKL